MWSLPSWNQQPTTPPLMAKQGGWSRGPGHWEGESRCLLRPPRNEMFHSSLEENIPVDSLPLSFFLLFLLTMAEPQTFQGEILLNYLLFFCSQHLHQYWPHAFEPTITTTTSQILIPNQLCLISHSLLLRGFSWLPTFPQYPVETASIVYLFWIFPSP